MAELLGEARICTAWNECLERFPPDRVDVYFFEEYVRLYEYQGYSAECFLYEEDDDVFAFPHLRVLRDKYRAAHDITTPYGYGGPISNRQDDAFYARGWQAMRETFAAAAAPDLLDTSLCSISVREKGLSWQRRTHSPRVTSCPWAHLLRGSAGASRASVRWR